MHPAFGFRATPLPGLRHTVLSRVYLKWNPGRVLRIPSLPTRFPASGRLFFPAVAFRSLATWKRAVSVCLGLASGVSPNLRPVLPDQPDNSSPYPPQSPSRKSVTRETRERAGTHATKGPRASASARPPRGWAGEGATTNARFIYSGAEKFFGLERRATVAWIGGVQPCDTVTQTPVAKHPSNKNPSKAEIPDPEGLVVVVPPFQLPPQLPPLATPLVK